MLTMATTNKRAKTGAWIAFAIAVSILAFVAYTSHKDAVPVQTWTADSSWKGGWGV